MKDLTCKDCVHYYNGACLARHISLPEECDICPFFADKDCKRPRFCRLASSVDEMAKVLIYEHQIAIDHDWVCWIVAPTGKCYDSYANAFSDTKAWLLEVEK